MRYFKIDNDEEVATEIGRKEYDQERAVAVLKNIQERRLQFGYPQGNIVDRLIERLILLRTPCSEIQKIVISEKDRVDFITCPGAEVSLDASGLWFLRSIPVEFRCNIEDYEICVKK